MLRSESRRNDKKVRTPEYCHPKTDALDSQHNLGYSCMDCLLRMYRHRCQFWAMVPSPERPTVEIIETKLDTYLHYMYNIYIYTYIFIMKGLVVLQNSTSFLAPGNWPRPDANRAHFTGKLAVDTGTHSWHLSRSRNLWSSGP